MLQIIWACALLLCVSSPAWSFPDTWDSEFKKAAARYLPVANAAWGWEILKAQCYQESLLKPDAVSPVGAQGLCQFMPATWPEPVRGLKLPALASPFLPEYAIPSAAWYMHRQRRFWKSKRPEWDRHTLGMACYNAGCGNLLKAQRAAGGALRACPILAALPHVTGHHARETQTYVRRTWKWWRMMRAL